MLKSQISNILKIRDFTPFHIYQTIKTYDSNIFIDKN
jgi:hypothetical protein